MSELKGACIFGQSGGPTSVINASAYGVIATALKNPNITRVLGAEHGIKGVLNDRLFDMGQEDPAELELLKYTPSSALGSCRYKMADPDVDDTDYKRILEIFKKYDVRYFFYNGGNDSMDTCNKISKYMQKVGYECRIMGVPKTIDNDLNGTDHCPGFASAAKYLSLIHILVRQAIDALNAISASMERLKAEMQALAAQLPEYPVVMAMHGVGDSLGPQLMAELGDVARFTHRNAITAFAGVDPGADQSGTHEAKSTRVSKSGPPELRRALFLVMDCLLKTQPQDDPVYRFMDKKRAEGKPYLVYMTAGANKFLRIYYGRVKEYLASLEEN